MTSIPQLRKDIAALQEQVRDLKDKLADERSKPPVTVVKVVEKNVPGPERIVYRDVERVVYRDNPDHIKMIKKLQGK